MQRQPLMALDRESVSAWVAAYERAWRTAGTDPLRDLFAADATYRMSPYEDAASGLAEIGELWERERVGPDEEFTLAHEIVAIEGDTAVVRLEVEYGGAKRLRYRDLWLLRFAADGRCREFEEWPFWPGQQIVAKGGVQ
ncbi:MAG TPA: nuclear transport factor 2 family protein [Solirubrobacterales bacterium]|nr:nuclear transport factor 2 family protein [Solirubrobacterales bacterium]